MDHKVFLLTFAVTLAYGFIVPINNEHECLTVLCENSGILINETCTCSCGLHYSGVLCEIELSKSEWPESEYSIPMSLFGCPETIDSGWNHGYINMTIPVTTPKHIWNDYGEIYSKPNILGPFYTNSIQLNFCIKRILPIEMHRSKMKWGKGQYCLLRSGNICPLDFNNGTIMITGYNVTSHDIGGHLPDVDITNTSVTLTFCCRDDGNVSVPMILPTVFPFILHMGPSESQCQAIKDMIVQKDVFYMTDINHSWSYTGSYPMVDNSSYDHRIGISYCYYTPLERRECYFVSDGGNSYNGKINISESGKACLPWANVSSEFVNSKRAYGEFEDNYCRGYGEDAREEIKPVCLVDMTGTEEYCNISICEDNDPDMLTLGTYKPYYSIKGSGAQFATDGLFVNGQAFFSARPAIKPWYQVDLQEHIQVHGIQTTRFARWYPVTLRFIGTYVSKVQWDFLNYGALRCDTLRFPRKARNFRFQCKRPIIGQYISLRNFDHTYPDNNIWRNFFMSIQELRVFGKKTNCGRPLGMISGNIYDFQIDSSSVLEVILGGKIKFISYKARVLNPGIGWCSKPYNDTEPWLSVDLVTPRRLQGILLQGWYDGQYPKFIKKFTVSYGIRRNKMKILEDPISVIKVFRIDTTMQASSIQRFIFSNDIMARWIRINPIVNVGESACLKMEVIGCHIQAVRDLLCRNKSIDMGFAAVRYRSWWTNKYYEEDVARDNITACSALLNACNQNVTVQKNALMSIQSPGTPLMYEQGLNCTWNIKAEDHFVKLEIVHINLAETVSLSVLKENGFYGLNPGSCNDILSLRDNAFDVETVILDMNEKSYTESIFISSSDMLSLNLMTCFQSSKQEQVYFQIEASSSDLPGCGMVDMAYTVQCRASVAYIASKRFPALYDNGDGREWLIEGSFGQYIEFEFINLDVIDNQNTCGKSYVAIYDMDLKGTENLIGRFCKTKRPYRKILSKWHLMRIEFRAGSLSVGRGFFGKYMIVNFTHQYDNTKQNDCENGWYKGIDSCYKFGNGHIHNGTISKQMTWITAEKLCVEQKAHLVSINTPDEMKVIHSLLTTVWDLKDNTELFIGLRKRIDETTSLTFSWTDGSPMTFTAWYQDPGSGIAQPDGLRNEQCTSIRVYSIHDINNWHDIACAYGDIHSYICERRSKTINEADLHYQLMNANNDHDVKTNIYFPCNNSQIISKTFVCDGKIDCNDKSDETGCDVGCTANQFQCNDGSCISLALYCDFIPHCKDASDESLCVRPSCSEYEWQCMNKQCIPEKQRCDLQINCFDGSDETNCDECDEDSFQCYDLSCIPMTMVCDGFVDCSGRFHEDENENCHNNIQESCVEWWSLGKRNNGEYLIDMGHKDISASLVYCEFEESNGSVTAKTYVHHLDEEIIDSKLKVMNVTFKYNVEEKCLESLKTRADCKQGIRIRCVTLKKNILQWTANNGEIFDSKSPHGNCTCPYVNRCDQNSCNCSIELMDWALLENNIKLEDKGIIKNETLLPIRSIYTSNPKNTYTWFEALIGPLICTETLGIQSSSFLCRSGVTIPESLRCLLDYDRFLNVIGCRDLSHLDDCDDFACPRGYVKCKESFCIAIRLMCDGTAHCAGGEDESHCENVTCPGLFKCKESGICLEPIKLCDGLHNCPKFDDEHLCFQKCPSNCTCTDLNVECITMGDFNINDVSVNVRKLNLYSSHFEVSLPEFNAFPWLTKLNLSYCKIKEIRAFHFHAQANMFSLDLSLNHLKILVANTFYGLMNLKELLLYGNIHLLRIEPRTFNGLKNLPDLQITQTQLSHISENTFDGLTNAKILNLSNNYILTIDDNAFNGLGSLEFLDLRGNTIEDFYSKIFNGLDSLSKLQTDSFVFCCLKPSTVTSEECFPQADEFSSCADLMRNDILRWSLWIIGICALLGNFAVVIYRFVFDKKTLQKGHGVLIANLGLSDLCMGLYLLIIASADTYYRGRYIWNDLSWRRSLLCILAGVLSTISSECSVVFLCLITVDRVLAVKFPFGQYHFSYKKAFYVSFLTWTVVLIIAVVPLFPNSDFRNEFYSRSAVCLALPLTRDRPAGWEYGTAIFIVFNFIVFVGIAIGQFLIYQEVAVIDKTIRSQRKNQDMAIARGLFLVIFTDFICWFPVGVMGLLGLSGYKIGGEVYAWTAVFILPINSALNPFLYTFSTVLRQRVDNRKSKTQGTVGVTSFIDIIKSDKFILDKRSEGLYTLADHMKTQILAIADMVFIVEDISSMLVILHERGMIHGSLCPDKIILEYTNENIENLTMIISPQVAMEDSDFAEDMHAVGRLTKTLLRSRQYTMQKSSQ